MRGSITSLAPEGPRARPLGFLGLVALIFYAVSGGPFGAEDAVGAGGPLLAILGFTIFPFIWCIPEAMVTAELATLFPHNSGIVGWVTAAFGPRVGFVNGWLTWFSAVVDLGVYPILMLRYLLDHFNILEQTYYKALFILTFSTVLTLLTYRGLKVVSCLAMILTVFTCLPFGAICLMGFGRGMVNTSRWTMMNPNPNYSQLLNTLFWNLNYWDSMAGIAGEVRNPQKVIPQALTCAVVLVCSVYLFPLLAGIGATAEDGMGAWQAGYFGTVAWKIGGQPLYLWIIGACAVSNIGQFEAEMSTVTYQIQGMAEIGFLPSFCATRSKHGTPKFGIYLCYFVTTVASACLDLTDLIAVVNLAYSFTILMEFGAFIQLRRMHSSLHRPFLIPLGTLGCSLMLLPAAVFCVIIILMPAFQGDWKLFLISIVLVAFGILLDVFLMTARKRKWAKFLRAPPKDIHEVVESAEMDEDCTERRPLMSLVIDQPSKPSISYSHKPQPDYLLSGIEEKQRSPGSSEEETASCSAGRCSAIVSPAPTAGRSFRQENVARGG